MLTINRVQKWCLRNRMSAPTTMAIIASTYSTMATCLPTASFYSVRRSGARPANHGADAGAGTLSYALALADLGADRVLGYDAAPDQTGSFEVIVDTVGTDLESYRRRLTRNGRIVTVGCQPPPWPRSGCRSSTGHAVSVRSAPTPDTALLEELAGYVASGALRPVVSRVFPLADIAAAHQAFGQGGILRKHVIAVAAA
jgi:NADPH:quinone reductase-like Zn-dependent oxidoreductase